MRFIVSTIGTSILTNSIDRSNPDEARDWVRILGDSANLSRDELSVEAIQVIDTLAERALDKLLMDDVETNRRASAELNGIYGIYEGTLPENSIDQHYLICTDTAQGQTTGDLIAEFLRSQGFTVSVEIQEGLSTKDTESFTKGSKELITWLDNYIPRSGSDWHVIFNLVGGFKSLQGYMQTFSTFYADETVYIFERSSDLIKIPRLPIQIDTTVLERHLTKFAMMAAGEMYPIEELADIPETLLEPVDGYVGLSAWGSLIWNRTKLDLLAKELLPFPRLKYSPNFQKDFQQENEAKARLELQETLAQIAYMLERSAGDTGVLEGGGFKFKRLQRFPGIFTFRVARGIRVSCSKDNGTLKLHRYGARNRVNNNPN